MGYRFRRAKVLARGSRTYPVMPGGMVSVLSVVSVEARYRVITDMGSDTSSDRGLSSSYQGTAKEQAPV